MFLINVFFWINVGLELPRDIDHKYTSSPTISQRNPILPFGITHFRVNTFDIILKSYNKTFTYIVKIFI